VRPESVPLLLVALLLVSAQPGVEVVSTVVGGDRTIESGSDAVIVLDGNATVSSETQANTSLYVVGGDVRIAGTLDGSVVQFAGDVTVEESATVTEAYRIYGGVRTVADGATVSVDRVAEPFTGQRTPTSAVGVFLLQALGLGVVAFLVGRRYPDLLANVGHAIRAHPAVSGTVGLLSIVTLLALFVFMAFTLVLLPVTVLGLAGGILVLVYAHVCVGYVLGDVLPLEASGPATAAGSVLFLTATQLLGLVPVVGGLVSVLLLVTATGAVVVTYFGLRRFQPVRIPPVE
jgi:hypothetical protein